ncbi:hypothetical protein CPC08DRAFT_766142 [Agrocybe pediades]|nr:hypothetical protein CPC08DRAFT_766142 [Agrocybe pediades]
MHNITPPSPTDHPLLAATVTAICLIATVAYHLRSGRENEEAKVRRGQEVEQERGRGERRVAEERDLSVRRGGSTRHKRARQWRRRRGGESLIVRSRNASTGRRGSRSTTPVPPSSSTTSFDDQMVVDETAPPLTTDEEVELFGEETAGAEEFTVLSTVAEYYENRRQLEAMSPEELVAELRRNAKESREPTPALRWEDEESDYGVDDPAAYADYYVDRQGLPLTPNQHPSKKRRNSVG